MKNSYLTVTDQFCGAGGSSLGVTQAGAEVRLAMNHWKLAIETHNLNFPETDHICTDISATDPRRYPSTDILITSPECTNHTIAKGKARQFYERDLFGKILIDPAEERSRATMWDVPRFSEFHEYNMIIVENVVDAGKWRLFESWLHAMHALGYEHEVVYFNSMFAWPTPQSRDRMYTVFWKKGNNRPDLQFRPSAWCEHCQANTESIQTWKKGKWGRYRAQYFYRCAGCNRVVEPYYYAALNAIDPTLQAERIGDRKKPLKPKTMARIQYGLEAYGRKPMIVTTSYGDETNRVRDAFDRPMPTQIGTEKCALVMPWLVETGYTHAPENRVNSISCPLMTQTTRQTVGIAGFLCKQYGGQADPKYMSLPLDEPTGTITTWDHHAFIQSPVGFIAEMHGNSNAGGLHEPLMCVTTSGSHHALLSADSFLTYYYGNTTKASPMTDPINTVTVRDRAGLVGALENMTVDDLTFRMLASHEIGKAMAFPKDYIVKGTSRDRVKQYGNAVTPPVMEMIMKRCMATFS